MRIRDTSWIGGLAWAVAFVENLTHVRGVPGVPDVVALASTAESEDQARFLADALDMLVNYHQTQTRLTNILAKGTIFGRDRTGVLIVPVEVDYVVWTNRAAYFAERPDLAAQKRAIWLSGRMSPLAKKNFESLGWRINENTQL